MRPGSLLAATGLALAGLAALAGSGGSGGSAGSGGLTGPGGPDPAGITAELATGEALLDPLELAAMIRERRPVRVVDVRDSSAFIRFSIPTARRATLAELAGTGADGDGSLVVVYDGDGGGEAVRAWLLPRRLGHENVRVLRGGVLGWLDHVLNPVLPAGSAEERARFDRVAGLSRYFGGMPRVGQPDSRASESAGVDAAITLLSRRGCY